MSEKQGFSTALAKVNDAYFPMIERQLKGNGIKMDDYAKRCVLTAISSINAVLDKKGISWNDKNLDQNNVTEILLSVASLKLNAAANPREVYFQIRNEKRKKDGNDVWMKKIEMGIEGDGNDAILANFGRGVSKVGQFWQVRSGDEFEYPSYVGLEMTPPKWKPKGKGKVVRVVYPIIKSDNTIEFYISERQDVMKNLIAHINNNLMNETFGIAKSRYDAKPKELEEINKKKREIIKKAEQLGLNALDDEELQNWISPAWTEPQSRESMIIRKMRNNVVKKIPKDFGNAYVEMQYSDTSSDSEQVKKEINENANSEPLDIDAEDVEEDNTVQAEDEPEPETEPVDDPPADREPEDAPEPEPADEAEPEHTEQMRVPGF